MRDLLSPTRISIMAGSALFVAACGGGESTVNESAANDMESNMLLDMPGNDASALESMEPIESAPPVANVGEEDVPGETSGGDTGGNTVDNDVAGM
jgi:hypothetical protein